MALEMKHCMQCGSELVLKELKDEGMVPYCPTCKDFRFPVFNVAVSMVILNETKDETLLIKQYGKDSYILVAGYVNKGEDAEDAVIREVKEEMGLDVQALSFNHSHYFSKSNTLMLNFTAIVEGKSHPNWEIDSYAWFPLEQAREKIRSHSLAEAFLLGFLDGKYDFTYADKK